MSALVFVPGPRGAPATLSIRGVPNELMEVVLQAERGPAQRLVVPPSGRSTEVPVGPLLVQAYLSSGDFAAAHVEVGAETRLEMRWTSGKQPPVVDPPRPVPVDLDSFAIEPMTAGAEPDDPLPAVAYYSFGRWQGDRFVDVQTLSAGEAASPLVATRRSPGRQNTGFLHVRRGDASTLVALPGEWLDADHRRCPVTVDLETLEVTVGDDTLGPVLRACTQGHLALARGQLDGVVREAEDALAGKRRNPFAAAAGALALFRLRALDRLHDWTGNLHRWFPGFSDGAILHATFLLRSRPDGFRGAAVEALSSAEAPPLFTGCVRLWIDACRQLEGTVPAKVRALGERCRASALFTTVDDLRDP